MGTPRRPARLPAQPRRRPRPRPTTERKWAAPSQRRRRRGPWLPPPPPAVAAAPVRAARRPSRRGGGGGERGEAVPAWTQPQRFHRHVAAVGRLARRPTDGPPAAPASPPPSLPPRVDGRPAVCVRRPCVGRRPHRCGRRPSGAAAGAAAAGLQAAAAAGDGGDGATRRRCLARCFRWATTQVREPRLCSMFPFFIFHAYVSRPLSSPSHLSATSLKNVNECRKRNASTYPQRMSYARSPRMRRASWMSFNMTVTRLSWMAHSWASWKRPTR